MVWYTFHHTWEVSNTLFMNYLQTSRAKANHKVEGNELGLLVCKQSQRKHELELRQQAEGPSQGSKREYKFNSLALWQSRLSYAPNRGIQSRKDNSR